jgi:hypothetical protein
MQAGWHTQQVRAIAADKQAAASQHKAVIMCIAADCLVAVLLCCAVLC